MTKKFIFCIKIKVENNEININEITNIDTKKEEKKNNKVDGTIEILSSEEDSKDGKKDKKIKKLKKKKSKKEKKKKVSIYYILFKFLFVYLFILNSFIFFFSLFLEETKKGKKF